MSLSIRPCGQPVPAKGQCPSQFPNSLLILAMVFVKGVTHSTLLECLFCFAAEPRKTAILRSRRNSRHAEKAHPAVRYNCILSLESTYIKDLASRRRIGTVTGRCG
jgi:hypothetical protein